MGNANATSAEPDNPFFGLSGDRQWNALIGQQGSEENYVDGYIEAAIELADAIIEKRMYAKRDTLVMPILFNARHALELSLKFIINKLHEMGVIKDACPKNHDIMSHWALLEASKLGDEALREYVTALKVYVISLSQIDDDGQELRYSENQHGRKSLVNRRLANIEVIRVSLDGMSKVMKKLRLRLWDLANERATQSYTAKCSRCDLLEIARMLPNRSDWREPAFVQAKTEVMKRFNLSGRQFSEAVDIIEGNREMGCLIGLETELAHLSDQNALFAVAQWAKLHPARPTGGHAHIVAISEILDTILEDLPIEHEVNKAILEKLKCDEVADLETIYYIGRDGLFCEHYERNLSATKEEHHAKDDLTMEVDHLMAKTNFQTAVACGVSKLGRRDLADKLLTIGRAAPHEG